MQYVLGRFFYFNTNLPILKEAVFVVQHENNLGKII